MTLNFSMIRKTIWVACILSVALCSCNSSKRASQKRRNMKPCDCPKFVYAPQSKVVSDFKLETLNLKLIDYVI